MIKPILNFKMWPVRVQSVTHKLTIGEIHELHKKCGDIIDNEMCFDPVVDLVSKKLNIPIKDILSDRRQERLCIARWCIFWLLRKRGMTLEAIGHRANKNPDTVAYGIAKLEDLIETVEYYRCELAWLKDVIPLAHIA